MYINKNLNDCINFFVNLYIFYLFVNSIKESLNLLSLVQPYLNITRIKNSYKQLQSRTFTCSFNIQSNFELQRAIYGQYDIIHISKNCCALHFYFTSPKYTVEKICFYLFRCSLSILSAYLINKKIKGYLMESGDKMDSESIYNKTKSLISTTIKKTINLKDTLNNTSSISSQTFTVPSSQQNVLPPISYHHVLSNIVENKRVKDFILKFIPFYLSYKLSILSKFGFFLWNNYPVNYIPIVVENNDMDGNSINNSADSFHSLKSDNKELFLVNKNTLAKEIGFWALFKKIFL